MTYEHESLGRAITAAIKGAGVTKTQLAKRTEHTWTTIHSWCLGRHAPSTGDLATISEMTGRPLTDLLGRGVPSSGEPPYPAWAEFLETSEYKMGDPWMIESLRVLRVPDGMEPVLETYKRLMFAMLSIEGESDD